MPSTAASSPMARSKTELLGVPADLIAEGRGVAGGGARHGRGRARPRRAPTSLCRSPASPTRATSPASSTLPARARAQDGAPRGAFRLDRPGRHADRVHARRGRDDDGDALTDAGFSGLSSRRHVVYWQTVSGAGRRVAPFVSAGTPSRRRRAMTMEEAAALVVGVVGTSPNRSTWHAWEHRRGSGAQLHAALCDLVGASADIFYASGSSPARTTRAGRPRPGPAPRPTIARERSGCRSARSTATASSGSRRRRRWPRPATSPSTSTRRSARPPGARARRRPRRLSRAQPQLLRGRRSPPPGRLPRRGRARHRPPVPGDRRAGAGAGRRRAAAAQRPALQLRARALSRGRILGVVPKTFLPNYREYYEKRWFAQGIGLEG